jgi:hypothetical protein
MSELYPVDLVVAGRTVPDVWQSVRRYCGLRWSGGPPEVWAYRYYDAVYTDPTALGPVDVLSASALHPGLSRADLAYFSEHDGDLHRWLDRTPGDVWLRDADDNLIATLSELAEWDDSPSLSLLTKVLHRKRPHLIPLIDSHVVDWYRPVTGQRSAARAWPHLLNALRQDLGGMNAFLLAVMSIDLEKEMPRSLGHLRLLDIALWMNRWNHTKLGGNEQ